MSRKALYPLVAPNSTTILLHHLLYPGAYFLEMAQHLVIREP